LEAGTIVGPSNKRLRVALATAERKIVKKYNIFLPVKRYLVLEEFDPRIHAMYFCPQLYRLGPDKKLVALEDEGIGKLRAKQLQDGTIELRPCYEPFDKLPIDRLLPPARKVILKPLSLTDFQLSRRRNS
jgi:hypothetical protein